jgi:hypothetical protein
MPVMMPAPAAPPPVSFAGRIQSWWWLLMVAGGYAAWRQARK